MKYSQRPNLREMVRRANGYILCGGRARRWNGYPKGLIRVDRLPLIVKIAGALTEVCDKIFFVTSVEAYRSMGYPVIGDLVEGVGPTGGIYTALTHSDKEWNIVVPCDMPYLTTYLFEWLLNQCTPEVDVIVPAEGEKIQPLCTIWNKGATTTIYRMITEGKVAIKEILKECRAKYIDVVSMPFYSEKLFVNWNSPEEAGICEM